MVTVSEHLVREILDRLIRLETLLEGHIRETHQRFDATNQRIDDTNARIGDTNQRITETNRQVAATNGRIDGTNERLDKQGTELRREFRSEFNKLLYVVLGTGAAIIATVLATNLFG